jgi:outer membrane receptor protein involved in Fe transport
MAVANMGSAQAQSDNAATNAEVIVTATRVEQPLRTYAGSITRIDEDAIALLGATHHSEVINLAPGAIIQRNSGQESLTALRSPVLSGPGSCAAFLFLEDGIAIRPVGFCNVNEMFEVNTEQARSIEVLRGPAGAVYGSSAMHGAINVLTARPSELPRYATAFEAGSDDYYRAKVAMSHVGARGELGFNGFATKDGGWRDRSGLNEQKIHLAYAREIGDGSLDVTLSATRLDQETAGFIQGEDAYKNEDAARSNANPEAYRDAHAVRLAALYKHPLGKRWTLQLRPYVRSSRMDFLQHFLIGKPLEKNGQDSVGLLTSFALLNDVDRRVVAGFDLERAEGFLIEDQAEPATGAAPAAIAIRPPGKHYDYEVTSTVMAAYVHGEQAFAERWRATAGIRAERVKYDYDNRMLTGNTAEDGTPCDFGGCLFNRPGDRSDTFDDVTPQLGLTYLLGRDHVLFVSAARGYRAPDTSELYRLQRQQSIADLDPERLDSLEIGLRSTREDLRYAIHAFAMRKKNVIFRDANSFNVSDGRTRHRGIEYEATWRVLPSLTLSVAGTYAKHTYDFDRPIEAGEVISSGNDIDTAPRHVNSARMDWQPLPNARAQLEWQSVGRYYLDASNQHSYPGHDVFNLRAAWRLASEWHLIVRLNNVFDDAYADRADFAFGQYRYFPGRGRSLFVEVGYAARR